VFYSRKFFQLDVHLNALTEDHGPPEERIKESRLRPTEKEEYPSLFDGQERKKICCDKASLSYISP
jgi:hypothetical protein